MTKLPSRCNSASSFTLNALLLCILPLHTKAFSSSGFIASSTHSPLHNHHNQYFPLFQQSNPEVIEVETATDATATNHPSSLSTEKKYQKPKWMKCINAVVPPNVRSLNEAVSLVANVTLSHANELITMGAVWAKMETLTDDDVLDQYYATSSSSTPIKYADLPSGWGSGSENDELYNKEEEDQKETLEEYVERQMALRYRRILTASTIDPGTDIRVYPHPRRFPSCYEFSDPERLLYEDTTFIVVDKPPLLPTQPEPSNYEECCPGCVNLLMGPFETIVGESVARPLICHRVDSCVGGCLVLSKDGNGQKVFSDLQVSFVV